ncbi:Os03g0348200 [Oryza sativa Japonica Group]|uniref:Os03g0348200 protein n=2 Tax=Oryza sativa TaxID=4530 RepID=Q0DRX1_ORYSJ|nr:Os03g0348200 [Oryza sativa Japonica Group]|eukprot:NP_001050103.1 Os03g0348200 [Oryza sativa Japonica Group]
MDDPSKQRRWHSTENKSEGRTRQHGEGLRTIHAYDCGKCAHTVSVVAAAREMDEREIRSVKKGQKMNLVDTLQRLGIDHLFEEEIATTLNTIHGAEFDSPSLHDVALRFRLLRQQGLWVSSDVFNKFKHRDGSFIIDITNDPKGLLSLYNAANLLTHNEEALQEAILFSRHHLELMKSNLKSPLAEQVSRALQIPLSRNLKRVEALSYILEYNVHEQTYNPSILELAKLDFNLLQHIHQRELKTITQWWEDLSNDIGLDYIRDRIVECYFWSYSMYFEEEYTRARMILAKFFMLTSLLDDTYDTHATLEECRNLNVAIQSWDESDISVLPDYLKKFFLKVMSNFVEFENELEPHIRHRNAYNRKVFQLLSGYYLQEAEWFHHNYVPSFKEQIEVSVMSAGIQALSVCILVGMGNIVTEETLEWAIGNNDAVRAGGEVARFMDDMAAFKNGRNKLDVASSVECYIKEYNVTSEVALAKIGSLVEDAWKTINQAHIDRRELLPFVHRVTNLSRSMAILFLDKRDAYTYSKDFKRTMESHFVKPIPL